MDVFAFREELVAEYERFSRSFTTSLPGLGGGYRCRREGGLLQVQATPITTSE